MEKLNLSRQLIRLGSNNLAEILGHDRLESLARILDEQITETQMSILIKKRYGKQIFSIKKIRNLIIEYLPLSYQNYLINEDYHDNFSLDDNLKSQIFNTKWDRRANIIKRLIEIFDLDDEYLPPTIIKSEPDVKLIPKNILFPHQNRIKKQFLKKLNEGIKRFIVHMPTGSGKTRTALEGVFDFLKTFNDRNFFIVWLAHSQELCEQALETITYLWENNGDEPLNVYKMWGKNIPNIDFKKGGIIITSYQKLHSMRLTNHNLNFNIVNNIKQNCKVIITDEAHRVIAETFLASIEFITDIDDTKIIGLTATPGRGMNHEENLRLSNFFNDEKISITDDQYNELKDPVGYLQNKGFLAKILAREVPSNFSYNLNAEDIKNLKDGFDFNEQILSKMEIDENRNLCILAEIFKAYREGRFIIVFALSLEHSKLLTELCNLKNLKVASIDDETSDYDRLQNIQLFRAKELQVLINYGVLTTGFDAPNTNTVIITRPTSSPVLYSQMLGRGIRGPKVGGNEECLLIDIKDNINGLPNEKRCFTLFNSYFS